MTRPAPVRQADIARVARALKAVGETVAAVDIRPDGSFRVLTRDDVGAEQALSPLEAWERSNGHRAA